MVKPYDNKGVNNIPTFFSESKEVSGSEEERFIQQVISYKNAF